MAKPAAQVFSVLVPPPDASSVLLLLPPDASILVLTPKAAEMVRCGVIVFGVGDRG